MSQRENVELFAEPCARNKILLDVGIKPAVKLVVVHITVVICWDRIHAVDVLGLLFAIEKFLKIPVATPAKMASPMGAPMRLFTNTVGTLKMSVIILRHSRFFAPPSFRTMGRLMFGQRSWMMVKESYIAKVTPSIMARTRWALVWFNERPKMTPRVHIPKRCALPHQVGQN